MNTLTVSADERSYYHRFSELDYFHVYNRSNNKEEIFSDTSCFNSLISGFHHYLRDYLRLLAFCVIPNHFHFAIQVRSHDEIIKNLSLKSKKKLTKTQLTFLESKGNVSLHDVVSQQFSNLFNSYAQQYNHAFERKGNLFNTNVKRIRINDQFQLRWLIYYIHSNPWHHGICDDFSHYPWNSFGEIISGRLDVIDRSIYSIYEGKESLIEYHKTAHLHKALKQLTFSSENEDVQGIKLLQ